MYKVKIDTFEGPFDLLVYLLESSKMNIYDIRVAEITEQYIDYLQRMGEVNIEISTEFIVLAAVLIKLKSKMLLPRVSVNGEFMIEEDPREELAQKLAEYVRTKKIAEMLREKMEYNTRIYEKPKEDISEYVNEPDEYLKLSTEKFVNAFMLFLEKKKKVYEVKKRYERVQRRRTSIEDRIQYMTEILNKNFRNGLEVNFSNLVPENADRYDLTLSFVSLLEMVKGQRVNVNQDVLYGEISVSKNEAGIQSEDGGNGSVQQENN